VFRNVRVVTGRTGKSTLTGTEIGVDVDSAQKVWLALQALGNIAFAYSYSMILIEIQVSTSTAYEEYVQNLAF
jgi:hypothetical protein